MTIKVLSCMILTIVYILIKIKSKLKMGFKNKYLEFNMLMDRVKLIIISF